MDVALVKSGDRITAAVEVPDGYDVDFIRHLYAQGEGLNVDGLTADRCPVISFESLRKKIEPCAPNMTIFWDASGNEVLVEHVSRYVFKIDGKKWTLLNEAEMDVFLGRFTGHEGRNELAKRLMALPLPG